MMQIPESYQQKNSLFGTMNRFIGAVNNMDRTVMVPSLLRDVPLADDSAATAAGGFFQQDGDMYGSYVLLKSIRDDMERGVLQGDERRRETAMAATVSCEDDLEKQFHFHLQGLNVVLSKLTLKANTLTSRYQEEIGCGN